MMVEVAFTPTPEDYIAVQRTMFARQMRSRRVMIRMALLVVAAIVVVVIVVVPAGMDAALGAAAGGLGGGLIGIALLAAITWWLLPRRSRRLFAQQRTLHHEHRTTFDAEGMRQVSERADVRIPWSDFPYWHLGRDVMLLYSNDYLAYFVPRRAFAGDQLEAAIALIAAAGVERR